ADDFGLTTAKLRYQLYFPEDAEGMGTGLNGDYFPTDNFKGKRTRRLDPVIDFNWVGDAPIEGYPVDQFTVRWTGFIEVPLTAEYKFFINADDSVRMWVN